MSDTYAIAIVRQREDKLEIVIESRHGDRREFGIIVDKDGLNITGDDSLIVEPNACNSIRVDYAA